MMKLVEELREYFKGNADVLVDVTREINGWNSSFEELDFWDNDEEFFDTFFSNNPMEAVRATHYGNYNYADEFVRFNGYGNLESMSEWQVREEHLDSIEEIIDVLVELKDNIWLPAEVEAIFDKYEDEDEEIA